MLIPLIIFINRSRYNDSKDYLSRFAKINNFQFSEIRALVLNLKIRSWQKYGVVMELEGVEVNMSYCYADNIIVIAIRTRYSLPKIALYTKEFISRRNKNKIFVNNEFDFKNFTSIPLDGSLPEKYVFYGEKGMEVEVLELLNPSIFQSMERDYEGVMIDTTRYSMNIMVESSMINDVSVKKAIQFAQLFIKEASRSLKSISRK